MSFSEELERSAPLSRGSPLNQACETRPGPFGTGLESQLDDLLACRHLASAIRNFSAIGCFAAIGCFSAAWRKAHFWIVCFALLGIFYVHFVGRKCWRMSISGDTSVTRANPRALSESWEWWCPHIRCFYHFRLFVDGIWIMANLVVLVPRSIQPISFYIFPWYIYIYLFPITSQICDNKYVFLRSHFIICSQQDMFRSWYVPLMTSHLRVISDVFTCISYQYIYIYIYIHIYTET